eukprot:gnl/TRDRNA2_/TRDRNA2_197939_c0_seq1.p1 gnl/TRDRNA2_/TRDRNA2_197939_c0~~gnl/TRDRNA2_/TRDRNA2_197939_c0_seq1.p1  ORF type:complete len:215 (-),score=43.07 gnl/TRDRNA2_/TRDRNA2_197939_c0_seq1:28-672(-)
MSGKPEDSISDPVHLACHPEASMQLNVTLGMGGAAVSVNAKASWTIDDVREAASAGLVPDRFILSLVGPGDKLLEAGQTLADSGLTDGAQLTALLGSYIGTWESAGSLFQQLGNVPDQEKLHLYEDNTFQYENEGRLEYPGDCGGIFESCGSGRWRLDGKNVVLDGHFKINAESGYDDGQMFDGEKMIPSEQMQHEMSEGKRTVGVWRKVCNKV